ncbi:MAG: M42 family peptidase, partial [Candidatus Hodarchaeota archaeon]
MDLESIKNLQKQLSNLFGVSGFEDEVSNFILDKIENESLADKAWKDPLGNVLAMKEGSEGKNRILFDAHTDEIGFMVSYIEKSGFLRFVLVGGWDIRILQGQAVILKSQSGKLLHGIIGSKPPHLTTPSERKIIPDPTKLYIDVGMSSDKEVINSGIDVGSVATLFDPFEEFPNNMVRGKAFDDRTGCNVLLQLM